MLLLIRKFNFLFLLGVTIKFYLFTFSEYDERSNYFPIHGYVINKNTVELFKESDKLMLIYEEGQKLIQQLKEGLILKDPSLLNTFLILSFAVRLLNKCYYYFFLY